MSFYANVIKKDPRFGSTECIKDIALLEPGTRAAVLAIIASAKAAGHELIVLETLRSPARQRMLYEQRKTELKNVGVHGYGLACDLGLIVGGKYDANGQDYSFLVAYAAREKMISGIDWGTPHLSHSFRDWDHVQRVPVFRQNALFAGSWYPPEDYDPHADMLANHITGI